MRIVAAAVALALLGACSGTLFNSKVDYKSAGKLAPLDVPPDLTAPSRDNRYQVPEGGRGTATLSGYRADRAQQPKTGSTSLLPVIEGMRIERTGDKRWLVVKEPAEKIWPQLKEFWQENGFVINLELPEAGVMETDWAENRVRIPDNWFRRMLGSLLDPVRATVERDKYRTRLERAPDGGTEIYISHRSIADVNMNEEPVKSAWQPRPPDPELEIEFLSRLMVRIGAPEEQAKALVAGTPAPPQRATLSKGLDGAELLELFEPFDRAWRRVGLALDRVGFTVEDRDRQKGVYFVRYADPEPTRKKEQGLLSRLAFWRDDGPKVKPEQYRVAIITTTERSLVQVLDKNGTAESSVTANRILALLHEQLK